MVWRLNPLTVSDKDNMVMALQAAIRRNEAARDDQRLRGVLLVAQGMPGPRVAQLLGDAHQPVANWGRRFETEGRAGLAEGPHAGRPSRLSDKQMARVEAALRAGPETLGLATRMGDGPTLSEFLAREWGVQLKVRPCQRLLRQLGFRRRKPRPQVAQAAPCCQPRTRKLHALARRNNVDLGAMAEVPFQQHGSRCRLGGPPEVDDPICLPASTRQSISWWGAVRLQDGKLVMSRPNGMFDAPTCWAFYRKRERHGRPGRQRVVNLGNARYHHARLHAVWRGKAAGHFCLDFLPPDGPELNPIGRVGRLIRRRGLHNRDFVALEDVIDAVKPTVRVWSRPNSTLQRLCGI